MHCGNVLSNEAATVRDRPTSIDQTRRSILFARIVLVCERIAVLVCPAVPTWDEMQALAPTIKSAFRPVARLRVRAFFSSSCVWCPIRHLNRVGKSAKRSGAFHQTIGGSIRTERSAQQGAVAHLARAANCSEHGAEIGFTDVGLRVDTRLLSGFRQVAGKQREGTLKVIYASTVLSGRNQNRERRATRSSEVRLVHVKLRCSVSKSDYQPRDQETA